MSTKKVKGTKGSDANKKADQPAPAVADFEKAMGFANTDHLKRLGRKVGLIVRDIRDRSRDEEFETRLQALEDALDTGYTSIETISTFQGFMEGLRSNALDGSDIE